jgi:putative transposase
MYHVRRVNIGKTAQLDELAHACGDLYSKTIVFFWRTVRHKGIWLKCAQMEKIFTSEKLHAHTSDATVQAFFASLKSWRKRRKSDPNAHPPRRRRWYFRIEYKDSAITLENGDLRLSNGRGNDPLVLPWKWDKPKTVVIHWTGTEYEAIATYRQDESECKPIGDEVAGIDLGEIHMAVSHDGENTHILNGRLLRSKRQYRNKLIATMSKKISRTKKGSCRRKKLFKSKQKQLRKLKNQIKDIEHKQTTRLVSTLYMEGVQTVVIGDVRDLRQHVDVGSKNNQKIHQWSSGSMRHMLTYKAERMGMVVELQDEHSTSKTCPVCEHKRKTSPSGRVFTCTKKECKWQYHRDGVGAINIRRKYLGSGPVVGDMAPPTGMRHHAHSSRSSSRKRGEKFDPGNGEDAARAKVLAECHSSLEAAYNVNIQSNRERQYYLN